MTAGLQDEFHSLCFSTSPIVRIEAAPAIKARSGCQALLRERREHHDILTYEIGSYRVHRVRAVLFRAN